MRSQNLMSSWWGKAIQLLGGALVILLLSVPAFSQGNTGRILGTVFDQSGGTVAGATVSVIDTERGVTRTLTTDDAGEYNAPNLTPSSYTVRAEAKGFKKLERQNIVLEVGKEVRIDLTVQPGAQEQTVTVTEAVPLVETTTATLGGTLENKEIADLPLNGRDYQNLMGLRPGVMQQVGGGPWTQSTNGVRPDESVWMIDGVINHNFYDHRPIAGMPSPITDGATILPLDSIQEFNLMENPKAEYGWDPGAVVNVGIKSGTNQIHGSAYGFYRSQAWDARNYFNFDQSGGSCVLGPAVGGVSPCAKTPAQLKQFGGSVGGPIKKDKLFFFGNYEGLRDLIGNVFGTTNGTGGVPETVPSGTAPKTANCLPAVLAVNPTADCSVSMVDALNNVIAGGGTPSAVSMALTGCTPGTTANLAATACTGGFFPNGQTTTNYLSTFPNVNVSDNGVGKIDYHINDKNTLNGETIISRYNGLGEDRGFINSIFLNGFPIEAYTASGTWDYTPNSRMVNEVRFGYNRMSIGQTNLDANVKNPVNVGGSVPGLPVVNIGNFGQLGTWHSRPQNSDNNPYWDAQESLSYLVGKHSLKFGYEWAHIEADTDIPDTGRGQISFDDLPSFFAGVVHNGKLLVGNPSRKDTWTSNAAFVQDDWRISPRFTLNLGLRYSYFSPLREVNNNWANFDPNSPTGLVQQGQPGLNTLWHSDRGDFSPRFGFAYDVNGKGTTVVRGGFSIIYSEFSMIEWQQQNQFQNTSAVGLGSNPTGAIIDNDPGGPNSCTLTNTCPTLGGNIAVKAAKFKANTMCWDPAVSACPAGQATVFPTSATISCSFKSQCAIMGVDPNLKTPYVMNFSLGVTHAFSPNLSLEVGYVGDHGARLTGFSDINQCPPNTGTCNNPYASKFPYFSFINFMTNDVRSNYNSLQTTLTKRMSHGLSLIVGYTYAHGLDNGSLNRFGLLPQNAFDPGAEYGNSDFDVRHRATITATYNVPGIKGFGQVLEGWQINTIVTLQSSQPWLVNDYNDASNAYACKTCGLSGSKISFPNGFSGTGDSADRWDFFGNPSDFKGTQNSIPFCSGFTVGAGNTINSSNAACSSTAGISLIQTTPANSSTLISNCAAKAPDPNTLAVGGCFANGGSVMVPQLEGTFGTMGRNMFRDSGFKDWDFSVFKNFTWKERYTAQFRLEMFNILNHPVFANPYGASGGFSGGNNDPASPGGFGGAIGTPDTVVGNPVVGSGDSRTIQVGLKLTF